MSNLLSVTQMMVLVFVGTYMCVYPPSPAHNPYVCVPPNH